MDDIVGKLVGKAVAETQWSVLERFSRITRLAANVWDHPLARPFLPYIPTALLPQHSEPPPEDLGAYEYEPARVYLARWAHEMQVARSSLDFGDAPPLQQITSSYPDFGLRGAKRRATVAEDRHGKSKLGLLSGTSSAAVGDSTLSDSPSTPPSPMLSSSISMLSGSTVENAKLAVPNTNASAGRLRILKEEQERLLNPVWDDTAEERTGLGSFEILSTDTTPPPPKVERQVPLSRSEWELFFDSYRFLPSSLARPSMMDSMIHLSQEEWREDLAAVGEGVGKIVAPLREIKRRIFAGGIDPEIRGEVWRYLFGLYPWDSTHADRVAIKASKTEEYQRLKQSWLDTATRLGDDIDMEYKSTEDDPEGDMYRDSCMRVDKDVHRTDRGHPFYATETVPIETPNVSTSKPHSESHSASKATLFTSKSSSSSNSDQTPLIADTGAVRMNMLRDILITYTCSYPGSDNLGFVQGMADLASPILVVMDGDEVDAFWCFTFLMDRMKANFRHDGQGMRTHLLTLSQLVKVTDPHLHLHLQLRELPFDDVILLWECLLAAPSEENNEGSSGGGVGWRFEHFVALAILDEHRDAIVRHLLTFDEVLKYVNDLSMTIHINATLEAAELLYLRFRTRAIAVGALSPVGPDDDDGAGEDPLIRPLGRLLRVVERVMRLEADPASIKGKRPSGQAGALTARKGWRPGDVS